MKARFIVIGIIVLILIWLASAGTYGVGQSKKAILFGFGKIEKTDLKPGLHFKLPIAESVKAFDGRIQTLTSTPQHFLTVNKRNVNVDYFVKWRISDTAKYYNATGGKKRVAESRLNNVIRDELRSQLSTRTIEQAVTDQRTDIMQALNTETPDRVKDLGIDVIDVRIKQIELPEVVNESIYKRMRVEREKVTKHVRSQGQAQAERIRAEADRQRTVILAKANAKAQKIRGGGEAKAGEIYAKAYNKDPEFYRFYRSLRVYRKGWSDKHDTLLLGPESELLKYLNHPGKSKSH
jgi:membrane protease subunit HflC